MGVGGCGGGGECDLLRHDWNLWRSLVMEHRGWVSRIEIGRSRRNGFYSIRVVEALGGCGKLVVARRLKVQVMEI